MIVGDDYRLGDKREEEMTLIADDSMSLHDSLVYSEKKGLRVSWWSHNDVCDKLLLSVLNC